MQQHSDHYYAPSPSPYTNNQPHHQSEFQNPNQPSAPPISPTYAASIGYASSNPPPLQGQGYNDYYDQTQYYSYNDDQYNSQAPRSGVATDLTGYSQTGGSGMMMMMSNYETRWEFDGGAYDAGYSLQYGNGGGGVNRYHQGGNLERYDDGGGVGDSRRLRLPVVFDDYGRPINLSPERSTTAGGGERTLGDLMKEAGLKTGGDDVDVLRIASSGLNGAQKFRVTLLAEGGGGQNITDVLCQVGLDGIRMLDPVTSRLLKIYPLETVTRWEVLDSDIFAFWTKNSTDFESRRIRLKSNSYTTSIFLDAVTASAIQLKEMAPVTRSADNAKANAQAAERKKSHGDWMNLVRLKNEEKGYWVPDEAVTKCMACSSYFGAFLRKHHCRNCGDIFCDKCSQGRITLTKDEEALPVRVCDRCMAEVTQRLCNESGHLDKANVAQSHEDLIKKLQDEIERQALPGFKAAETVANVQEVACPTCTVHLKVVLPALGSKTIECSVCRHPFLVNAA